MAIFLQVLGSQKSLQELGNDINAYEAGSRKTVSFCKGTVSGEPGNVLTAEEYLAGGLKPVHLLAVANADSKDAQEEELNKVAGTVVSFGVAYVDGVEANVVVYREN